MTKEKKVKRIKYVSDEGVTLEAMINSLEIIRKHLDQMETILNKYYGSNNEGVV